MKNIKSHYQSDSDYQKNIFDPIYNERIKEQGYNKIRTLRDNFENVNQDSLVQSTSYHLRITGYSKMENDAYNYLYYSNQLNKAWFEYNMNEGKSIKLTIVNKIVETTGKFNHVHSIGAGGVAAAILFATILRDRNSLDFYANIPFEFTEKAPQHHLLYEIRMALFQTLIKRIGNEHEAHGAYYEYNKLMNWDEFKKYINHVDDFLTESVWHDHIFEGTQRLGKYIFLPELAIYHSILHKDQESFEEAVYDALTKWKEYYTMKYTDSNGEEKDHSLLAEGYWAIPIIAACAFAYDRGMKLKNVESDYLCDWMIEGRFEGFELLIKD